MSDILALTLVCFAVSVLILALLINSTPCTLPLHAVVVLFPSQLLLVLFLVRAGLVNVGHKYVEWNRVPFDYPFFPL